MGSCSSSQQQADGVGGYDRRHIFKVMIIDGRGQDMNSGQLEVTYQELVLHQKSKESIRWPLWSLRRYGFDKELFTFESGRRCPTGPGVYAFRCHGAEELFSILQLSIIWAGQMQENRMQMQRNVDIDSLDPLMNTTLINHLRQVFSLNSNDAAKVLHNYMNYDPNIVRQYYNLIHKRSGRQSTAVQYADLDLASSEADNNNSGGFFPFDPYLFPEASGSKTSPTKAQKYVNYEVGRAYVNVPLNAEKRSMYVNVPTLPSAKPGTAGMATVGRSTVDMATSLPMETTPRKLDWRRSVVDSSCAFQDSSYASATFSGRRLRPTGDVRACLDIAGDRRSVAVSPGKPTFRDNGYAVMDFDKMKTLNEKKNGTNEDAEGGMKKTRHSCNVEAIYYC